MHVLRPALTDEAGRCYGIIEEAKAFQREQGFIQWTEDNPSQETVAKDIRDGKGLVITSDGEIAGYMCIDFTGEPAYDCIDGSWNSDEPYAVVHRMAFDRKFIGCALYRNNDRRIGLFSGLSIGCLICKAQINNCIRVHKFDKFFCKINVGGVCRNPHLLGKGIYRLALISTPFRNAHYSPLIIRRC